MLYNKDYYTGMPDELATELLGVREAHASFKELSELIKTRRERIEELKKLIPQKKSAFVKAEVALKKAAKAAEEGGKKFTDGELKAKEYEELVSAAKKAEEHAAKLGNSISKLEKELKELEAEESAWLKTEEKLTTKQRRALKKAMAAAAAKPKPTDDDDDSDDESKPESKPDKNKDWDEIKGSNKKSDEDLAKELDDLYAGDGEDDKDEDEFEAAMDKFLKAMEDSDDEDEDSDDKSEEDDKSEDESGNVQEQKTVYAQKKEKRSMKNSSLNFYTELGSNAFDYDHGKGMTDSLREWIKSTLEDDRTLAEDAVLSHLGAILKKNPDLIDAVKDAIVKAEEYNMPYKTVFVSKVTGFAFETKAEAEESIKDFLAVGATNFESCFEVKHMANGAYVEEDEVLAYIDSFDGDRDALRRQLHMTAPAKAAKPGKGKAAKA